MIILCIYLFFCTVLLCAVIHHDLTKSKEDLTLWVFIIDILMCFTPLVNLTTLWAISEEIVILKARSKQHDTLPLSLFRLPLSRPLDRVHCQRQ